MVWCLGGMAVSNPNKNVCWRALRLADKRIWVKYEVSERLIQTIKLIIWS